MTANWHHLLPPVHHFIIQLFTHIIVIAVWKFFLFNLFKYWCPFFFLMAFTKVPC